MALFQFLSRKDSPLLFIGAVFCLLDAAVEPVSSILIGKVFTSLEHFSASSTTAAPFMSKVLSYCIGMWCLAAAQFGISWVMYTVWSYLGYLQGHRARQKLYTAIIKNNSGWFDENEKAIGSVTMSFKDVQDLELAAGISIGNMIVLAVSAIIQLGVAFYFSWAVTLVSLAGVPLLIVLTASINPFVEKKVSTSKHILDVITDHADWVLSSLPTVKIFQRRNYECEKLAKDLKEEQRYNMGHWHLSQLQQGLGRFLLLSMFVQGFYFGSYMVRNHGLSSGSVMTVFWSCLSAASQFQQFLEKLIYLQKGRVSAARLDRLTERDGLTDFKDGIGLMPPSLADGQGEIKFDNVCFSYPSRPGPVLLGASMAFEAGEATYVVGPSGCGKSSLANLISKQYNYQSGMVCINNIPVPHFSNAWIEQNIYVVEQQAVLFDIPLSENIRIGSRNPADVTEKMVAMACQEMCADFVYALPNGIETMGTFPLSGGQTQRVGLARARLRDAPIMIFDESTSSLDPRLQEEVMTSILEYRAGKTTIIITHQLNLVPKKKPLYVLRDGVATRYSDITDLKRQTTAGDPLLFTATPPSAPTSATYTELTKEPATKKISLELFMSIPNKFALFLGFLIVAAHATLNPVFAYAFSRLLVGLLPTQELNVVGWAMGVLAIAFADGLLSYCSVLLEWVAENWQRLVRSRLFSVLVHKQSLSKNEISYYTKLLFSDSERCRLIITTYWSGWINMVTLGTIALIWSVATGWKLALVGLSVAPVFLAANQAYKRFNTTWTAAREAKRALVVKLLVEVVSGIRTVKTQRLEKYFERYYMDRERAVNSLSAPMSFWVGAGFGMLRIFPLMAQGLMIWYSMKLISTGEYDPADAFQIFAIVVFALMTIDTLANSIPAVSNGFEAVERYFTALNDQSNKEDDAIIQDWDKTDLGLLDYGSIDFTDVGVQFPDGSQALGGWSESIKANDTVAIVGPSGSGKSTIARLLLVLEKPTQGAIYLGNRDIQSIPIEDIRKNVAMAGQMPLDFVDATIMENLLYAVDDDSEDVKAEALEICKQCGIHDFISGLEDGYNTRIKRNLLSGGQMQRLGLVRALLRKAKVLILDECTSALDNESTEYILRVIENLKKFRTTTIIIITHKMSVTGVADRVISLF